jgi:hypothetical protein
MCVRLHIVAEGQTEETFVNSILVPHLALFSVFADVRCIETGRSWRRIYRGGMTSYEKLRNDLVRWMRQDDHEDCWFTSMIDLYGLERLDDEFPGLAESHRLNNPYERVESIEQAFARDIDHHRFIPHIQLHEFEALILADTNHIESVFLCEENELEELSALVNRYASPEEIDDGESTAPSKRIISLLPQYDGRKSSSGPIIAGRIGIPVLRQRCPHFGEWLARLESLGKQD